MRRTRRAVCFGVAVLGALLLPGAIGAPAGGGTTGAAPVAAGPARPTRADLDRARRRAALLEAEQVLTATRKPYIVLDLETATLRYGLMGMEVRRIELRGIEARGLRPAPAGARSDATLLAGIVTLKQKEDDPRLSPLSPEEIEAGLDDEDAADVLPPEAPAAYGLEFQQRIVVRVAAVRDGAASGAIAAVRRAARRLADAALWRDQGDRLRLDLRLDEATSREVYRSLVPGERLIVVPPRGLVLPAIGQESPRAIRPGRPAPRPEPQPSPRPGVPFRIPPPVDGLEAAPAGADAPPQGPTPPEPSLSEPEEADPGAEEPLPDDWEDAGPEGPGGDQGEPPATSSPPS